MSKGKQGASSHGVTVTTILFVSHHRLPLGIHILFQSAASLALNDTCTLRHDPANFSHRIWSTNSSETDFSTVHQQGPTRRVHMLQTHRKDSCGSVCHPYFPLMPKSWLTYPRMTQSKRHLMGASWKGVLRFVIVHVDLILAYISSPDPPSASQRTFDVGRRPPWSMTPRIPMSGTSSYSRLPARFVASLISKVQSPGLLSLISRWLGAGGRPAPSLEWEWSQIAVRSFLFPSPQHPDQVSMPFHSQSEYCGRRSTSPACSISSLEPAPLIVRCISLLSAMPLNSLSMGKIIVLPIERWTATNRYDFLIIMSMPMLILFKCSIRPGECSTVGLRQ